MVKDEKIDFRPFNTKTRTFEDIEYQMGEKLRKVLDEKFDKYIKEKDINGQKPIKGMPKNVLVCGINFKVELVPVVNKETPEKGEINYLTCVIKIDQDMPKDLQVQVLIHEILHAILDLTGNDDIGTNEKAVQSISTALYCLISQNKLFLS